MLWCWKGEVGGALWFQNTLPKVPGSGVTSLYPPLGRALLVSHPWMVLWCNPFCRYVTLTAEGAPVSEMHLEMWNPELYFNHLAAQNKSNNMNIMGYHDFISRECRFWYGSWLNSAGSWHLLSGFRLGGWSTVRSCSRTRTGFDSSRCHDNGPLFLSLQSQLGRGLLKTHGTWKQISMKHYDT